MRNRGFPAFDKPCSCTIAPLRQAVAHAPNPALIQIMLGQALVATNDRARADEAVSILQTALAREPESADGFMQLAMAYGHKNDLARADLASAAMKLA